MSRYRCETSLRRNNGERDSRIREFYFSRVSLETRAGSGFQFRRENRLSLSLSLFLSVSLSKSFGEYRLSGSRCMDFPGHPVCEKAEAAAGEVSGTRGEKKREGPTEGNHFSGVSGKLEEET